MHNRKSVGIDSWGAIVGGVLVVGSGTAVMLGSVDVLIPLAVWAVLFLLTCGMLVVTWLDHPRVPGRLLLCAIIPFSWLLLLTAPDGVMLGLTALPIAVAASMAPVFRLPTVIIVAAVNTLVCFITFTASLDDSPTILVIVTVFVALLQLGCIVFFLTLEREQKLRSELAEAYVGLHAAEAIVSEAARATERLHIARELHDALGHELTLLNITLEAAKHHGDAGATEHVARAQRISRSLLTDVRATVADLRTARVSALPEAIMNIGRDLPGLDVDVTVSGDINIDEERQTVLFRVIQEIVTNTVRHAKARTLTVAVCGDTDRVLVTASDDGRGAPDFVPGHGMQGLEERVSRVGGHIEFRSQDGFTVRAEIPKR